MKKPELLAPAGNFEKLKMSLLYGADAVYLGGENFSLRAAGGNFTLCEIKEAVKFAHELKKKVYVTVNVYPRNDEFDELSEFLRFLARVNVDGVLVSDLGVFSLAQRVAPTLTLHISTQANSTNFEAVSMWETLGAKRVVLARELSLAEVCEIRKRTDIELELFVHGAMCISYSGRCLLSNYFTGRDSNRGSCTQPCRWKYSLQEETRPGKFFPIEEDERGTYIMNSKDLCLLPRLDEIIKSGVDSFKIEGRMKSVHYAASVTKVYREAIDAYFDNPGEFAVKEEWLTELNKVSHRDYTTGFLFGEPTADDQIYGTSSYLQTSDFVGLVLAYDEETKLATVEQRNNMKCGQELEVFSPHDKGFRFTLCEMYDEDGETIDVAPHPQQIVKIKFDKNVEPYSILRRDI